MANKQMIDAMWDDSPVDVSTEVNFIWSIANKLRGPYRSDKYKDVIIPMTIIRRFECALAPTKQKVVEQFKANPNFPAKAMYRISGFQFYNTSEFDLSQPRIKNDALCFDISDKIVVDVNVAFLVIVHGIAFADLNFLNQTNQRGTV